MKGASVLAYKKPIGSNKGRKMSSSWDIEFLLGYFGSTPRNSISEWWDPFLIPHHPKDEWVPSE